MELDELRQRWQQAAAPPAAPPDLSGTALRQLLSRRSGSPVARMERNLWLETGFAGLVIAFSVGALLVLTDAYARTRLGWLLLVCLLCLPYYARKLQIIRRLREVRGSIREHTREQVSSLRALIRLYYLATMWTLPVTFGITLFFMAHQIGLQLQGPRMWVGLGIFGVAWAAIGLLAYFATRSFTRWYLQKLYGQHLDRLERSLAELEEPALDVSR